MGLSYTPVTFTAHGGIPPYSWSVGSGSLPPGVGLSSGGVVSGSPTGNGQYNFGARVADSSGRSITATAGITIYKALALTQPCLGTCVIGAGCSKCGGFGSAANGLGPYTYQIVGGAVPRGMGVSGLALTGPFPAGSYNLSIRVTDKLGAQGTVAAKWSIYSPAKSVAGTSCSSVANPPQCSTVRWSYSGGNPTLAPKVVILGYTQYCDPLTGQCDSETTPPPNWSVSVKGGVITMSAGGIPCNAPKLIYWTYLTLVLVDPSACPTTSQSNRQQLLVYLTNNC